MSATANAGHQWARSGSHAHRLEACVREGCKAERRKMGSKRSGYEWRMAGERMWHQVAPITPCQGKEMAA